MDLQEASAVLSSMADPAAHPSASLPNEAALESIKMEQQLVRVPFEHLKKYIRVTARLVEKDVGAVVTGVSEAAEKGLSAEEATRQLDNLLARLHGLKRKLDASCKQEQEQCQRCKARADHLVAMNVGAKEEAEKWDCMRVNRLLIDYMLRSAYYDSAQMLAKVSGLQDLADTAIFVDARKVIDALRRHDCSEALAWCSANKYRLKKSKSSLEFQLRIREMLELVRAEKMLEAIQHARKHLAPWGLTHMKELQQAMATLAFRSSTECLPYKELFAEGQWEVLVRAFQDEFLRMYGMTAESLLHIHLHAGLAALKTPFAEEDGCPLEDPLAQPALRALAAPLPFSKHIRSKLVCRISREMMDGDNPPLVLPNGYAYSRKAMESQAQQNNGKVVCPRTGQEFNFEDLTKAYVF
eukprot:TRINITY_DN14734_c0_g1_i1.p1 TRINITY_DN14734_c0_g1~~TRINITY_DN14734_c0_g1_i1.p1  ORF type:complete len:411 (+),score=105.09 TRINITY_DN14734_c0_g1_i1:297-1529(+)